MRYRNNRRRSMYHRKKRKNPIPLILFFIIIGFILWSIFQIVASVFSSISTEPSSAEVQIIKGQASFRLPDNSNWSLAFSEQKLWPNESIRTNEKGKASLDIFDSNTIFLAPNTEVQVLNLEEKSNQEKIVQLKLNSGEIWAKTSGDAFKEKNSQFQVQTDRLNLYTKSATFDLSHNAEEDIVRLIKGDLTINILNGEEKDKHPISVTLGVGQEVIINDETIAQLQQNKEILTIIDTGFIESEWHLDNLEVFFPQEAQKIKTRIESQKTIPSNNPDSSANASSEVESPTVITPKNGITIPSSENRITIEGTAPLNAFQIEVNGFALTRFTPGDKKWRYFAGVEWGTLVHGENTYSIVTITQDGKRSIPTVLKINYEGSNFIKKTPLKTASITETLPKEVTQSTTPSNFSDIVITSPETFDANGIHQTAQPAISIKGTVDPQTQSVEVNRYKLKRFSPGDTKFSYTAVNNGLHGNMKVGENIYHITAFGPNGKKASTTVKINYTPVDL